MKTVSLCLLAVLLGGSSLLAEKIEKYRIDPAHSGVSFKVRHFFSKVPGSFGKFSGTLTVDRADLEKSHVQATIQVPSIDTNNEKRDNHLRNPDYFNASKFPEISFVSKEWEKTGENRFQVTGDLTMYGQTHEVVLDAELLGFGPGRGEDYLTGWEATTTIDRTRWGITAGTPAVGEEVEIEIQIEAVRENPAS